MLQRTIVSTLLSAFAAVSALSAGDQPIQSLFTMPLPYSQEHRESQIELRAAVPLNRTTNWRSPLAFEYGLRENLQVEAEWDDGEISVEVKRRIAERLAVGLEISSGEEGRSVEPYLVAAHELGPAVMTAYAAASIVRRGSVNPRLGTALIVPAGRFRLTGEVLWSAGEEEAWTIAPGIVAPIASAWECAAGVVIHPSSGKSPQVIGGLRFNF